MTVVLDASAVLALVLKEPGADVVLSHIRGALLSAVNLVEVIQRMVALRVESHDTLQQLARLEVEVVPFDVAQAAIVASLREKTRHKGLSLADRACVALARTRNLPAYTADQIWAEIDHGARIVLIR